jgi:hypothetical protein
MQRSSTGVCAVDVLLKQKSRQMDSRFDPHMDLPIAACTSFYGLPAAPVWESGLTASLSLVRARSRGESAAGTVFAEE